MEEKKWEDEENFRIVKKYQKFFFHSTYGETVVKNQDCSCVLTPFEEKSLILFQPLSQPLSCDEESEQKCPPQLSPDQANTQTNTQTNISKNPRKILCCNLISEEHFLGNQLVWSIYYHNGHHKQWPVNRGLNYIPLHTMGPQQTRCRRFGWVFDRESLDYISD
jgi:hypothetical protein